MISCSKSLIINKILWLSRGSQSDWFFRMSTNDKRWFLETVETVKHSSQRFSIAENGFSIKIFFFFSKHFPLCWAPKLPQISFRYLRSVWKFSKRFSSFSFFFFLRKLSKFLEINIWIMFKHTQMAYRRPEAPTINFSKATGLIQYLLISLRAALFIFHRERLLNVFSFSAAATTI